MNLGRAIPRLPKVVKFGLLNLKHLYHGVFASLPLPALLPYGGLLLAWDDYNGDSIFTGNNTEEAYAFVEAYLRTGMTALDIGAHHGFYTILASKRVGSDGRVVAFEPSPRERRELQMNLRLNHCSNVTVEPYALASYDGSGTLYVVASYDTGCNSLRPPNLHEATTELPVQVTSLDVYLARNQVERVNLVKIDAEGAELEILKGAASLLLSRPRPVILCEVMDVRTKSWGYDSRKILEFVASRDYGWFQVGADCALQPLAIHSNPQGTFVAIPKELLS